VRGRLAPIVPPDYTAGMPRTWVYVAVALLTLCIVANLAFATFVQPGIEPIMPNDDLTEDFI
jgi:hypothetical protein